MKGLNKVLLEPGFLQAEQLQLSQTVLMGGLLHPSDHFLALLWTHPNKSLSFLCWGPQSWMEYSWEWRGRITSFGHASFYEFNWMWLLHEFLRTAVVFFFSKCSCWADGRSWGFFSHYRSCHRYLYLSPWKWLNATPFVWLFSEDISEILARVEDFYHLLWRIISWQWCSLWKRQAEMLNWALLLVEVTPSCSWYFSAISES